MAKYPRLGSYHSRMQTKDLRFGSCGNCRQPIAAGKPLTLIDIQVSEMRGDDSVVAICLPCSGKHLNAKKLLEVADE